MYWDILTDIKKEQMRRLLDEIEEMGMLRADDLEHVREDDILDVNTQIQGRKLVKV